MKEILKPILTEAGLIYGRNAIYLDKVNVINEQTFELSGEFNGSLCSNIEDEKDVNFVIIFKDVRLFKMIELDFMEFDYVSSFDLVENSKQLQKMVSDLNNTANKIDKSYQHYVFVTYDTVFEIIGKEFQLTLV